MRNVLIATLLILLGMGCVSQLSIEEEVAGASVEFPNEVVVHVDLADDYWERIQGLSGRSSLEVDEGLLFLFPETEVQRFWMKDMQFPIDIIWIEQDRVVGFVESAQPENPPTTIYTSPTAVDKVLEVSAGFVTKNDVKIGDILDIQLVDE